MSRPPAFTDPPVRGHTAISFSATHEMAAFAHSAFHRRDGNQDAPFSNAPFGDTPAHYGTPVILGSAITGPGVDLEPSRHAFLQLFD